MASSSTESQVPPTSLLHLLNPWRAISENDLRIYSTSLSSSSNEEEEGDGDRGGRYSKKAGLPETTAREWRMRKEESVEVNTEDEQSSRWETDNRLECAAVT